MNENIDIRMSNYLRILSNPELCKNFEPTVVRNMETAVTVYVATTSKKYVDDFHKQQVGEEAEKVNSAFR